MEMRIFPESLQTIPAYPQAQIAMNSTTTPSIIMETVSENTPKPKRGRPKSSMRIFAEELQKVGAGPESRSARGQVNSAYETSVLGAWIQADPDTQTRILGFTDTELEASSDKFPRGFKTAATEIGRWLEMHNETDEAKQTALRLMADARDNGIAWRDIKMHFRKLRLGERKGNAISLYAHLAHAYDDYCRMFPATTQTARLAGIRNLLDAIESPDE